ncbi:SspB family protein [Prosthecomicrobium pneumaticum]|uniref:Stringent starvation protein B n=1 Tax=Prosthecomicrobium pneumaticum TaxID=81895 RepID=A0A7W9L453_9HYPH|nr:SspB family protein [Prosthecomicrobium pneumaticum]MBB5755242.1 hypothetical protein [Prosthecomicrobium pneumaticum]
MAEDLIRYDILAQDALRGVIRKVLAEVARTGLPGDHHFYITFDTRAPGVRLSTRLAAQHPQDMTIVLQHQFWDLAVTEHAFEVGLSFHGVPERLLIPFTAIKAFLDPSVEFGLQFEVGKSEAEEEGDGLMQDEAETEPVLLDAPREPEPVEPAPRAEPAAAGSAEVVRLDAFRKKN